MWPLRREPSPLKGLLAGAVGGLLGTLALDLFQQAALSATRKAEDAVDADHTYSRQQEQQIKGFERAHADTADALTGGHLSHDQRKVAAPLTHYAFGMLCGGAYGLVAEYVPAATAGFGTAFGSALFLAAQEGAVPALGLSPTPEKIPAILHVGGLTAHSVYGATTEGTRLLLRKIL